MGAKRFDHKLVIIALRQAGHGYDPDNAGAFHMDRKAATVGGEVSSGVAAPFQSLACTRIPSSAAS